MTFSETFLVFLVPLVVFLGVKFGIRKSCQCKRNDKYEVWRKLEINTALSSVINIYWGLFCPMFRRIAFCPQSSRRSISIAFFKLDFSDIVSSDGKILIQRSLLRKTFTDPRGRDARIHMCRSLCFDTLFFSCT